MRRVGLLVILIFVLSFAQGCATVHQVDRGRLARRMMQFDPEPHQQDFLNEAHAIREGASGGAGQSAGGGCGCN